MDLLVAVAVCFFFPLDDVDDGFGAEMVCDDGNISFLDGVGVTVVGVVAFVLSGTETTKMSSSPSFSSLELVDFFDDEVGCEPLDTGSAYVRAGTSLNCFVFLAPAMACAAERFLVPPLAFPSVAEEGNAVVVGKPPRADSNASKRCANPPIARIILSSINVTASRSTSYDEGVCTPCDAGGGDVGMTLSVDVCDKRCEIQS